MSEGNGVDLGHTAKMLESLIVAQDGMRREVKGDIDGLRRELKGDILRVDRKVDDLQGQVSGLRQTLTEYHSAVLGHGILISETRSPRAPHRAASRPAIGVLAASQPIDLGTAGPHSPSRWRFKPGQ